MIPVTRPHAGDRSDFHRGHRALELRIGVALPHLAQGPPLLLRRTRREGLGKLGKKFGSLLKPGQRGLGFRLRGGARALVVGTSREENMGGFVQRGGHEAQRVSAVIASYFFGLRIGSRNLEIDKVGDALVLAGAGDLPLPCPLGEQLADDEGGLRAALGLVARGGRVMLNLAGDGRLVDGHSVDANHVRRPFCGGPARGGAPAEPRMAAGRRPHAPPSPAAWCAPPDSDARGSRAARSRRGPGG